MRGGGGSRVMLATRPVRAIATGGVPHRARASSAVAAASRRKSARTGCLRTRRKFFTRGLVSLKRDARERRVAECVREPARTECAVGWVVACVCAAFGAALVSCHLTIRLLRQRYNTELVSKLSSENDALRKKVEDLRAMATTLAPSKAERIDEQLDFVPGVNKDVILARVENMLADEKVNVKWLPDIIEKQLYLNVLSLMLQVMNDVLKGMSMEFAGHRVKFDLTFLDLGENPKSNSEQLLLTDGEKGNTFRRK